MIDPPARTVTWLKCPNCDKRHVAPPMGAFTCPCGAQRWWFGWTGVNPETPMTTTEA